MDIIQQLKRDEDVRLKPYRDSVGKLTIGVGRNLDDVGISESESDYLLANDVAKAKAGVLQHLPWSVGLDEARFGVLLNMAFNLGVSGLLKFPRMLSKVQQGLYNAAAADMEASMWYGQVGGRAKRLVQQMRTGIWF